MGRKAACTAADDAVQDIVSTCSLLANCSAQIENQPLKSAMEKGVVSVVGALEAKCREWIGFMVQGLSEWAEEKVQYDILWTLRLLSEQSTVAKRWILEVGGHNASAAAMASHPHHEMLTQEGTSLVYELLGVNGLISLLKIENSNVQTATVWQIYDRCKERGSPAQGGSSPPGRNAVHWPEAGKLVVTLIEVMQANLHGPLNLNLLWSCCSALRRLLAAESNRSRLFYCKGGVETLLGTIRAAHTGLQHESARDTGEGLLTAVTRLATVVADSSEEVVAALRVRGLLPALVGDERQGLQTQAAEDIMWTVGQVHGPNAVLEAMAQVAYSRASVHGGLVFLSESVWNPSIDWTNAGVCNEYMNVAPHLLNLAQMGLPAQDRALALKALGGVLHILAPKVAPGSWKVADDSAKLLADAVRLGDHKDLVQEAAESLGRVACISPLWRDTLRQTIGILSARLRTNSSFSCEGLLKKYLFWATAAIAGLPAVLEEMRSQQGDPQVQDAAFCAIIDILDDDMGSGGEGGDFSLRKERDSTDCSCFAATVEVVVAGMNHHGDFVTVQSRGCRALGLLQAVLPESQVGQREVIDVILKALWRHSDDHRVMQGVSFALRAILEPRKQSGGGDGGLTRGVSKNNVGRSVALLQSERAGSGLWSIVHTFDSPSRSLSEEELAEMLEDTLFVLGMLQGIPSVCDSIEANEHLRVSGLKALFELLRAPLEGLLTDAVAIRIRDMLEAIYRSIQFSYKSTGQGPGASSTADVQRQMEMLQGLLTIAQQQLG
mmetsp:Transcript_57553/g.136892  ORF Transcript_57553/g.136892 Transcript_57553/m.136892 type:complete len:778 (-) Transcript_57553:25-2358(-)